MRSVRQLSNGYSLIEVMVAVLILSLGLAGMGLLQVINVKNTYNANSRSTAATYAKYMAEQMRANVEAYERGQFVNASTGSANNCVGSAVDCTPQQLAQDDLNRWQNQLDDLLPQGQGIICVDGSDGATDDGVPGAPACSGNGQTVVKIFWRETANAGGNAGSDVDNEWQAYGLTAYP